MRGAHHIEFSWEGEAENATGKAVYQLGTTSYEIMLPSFSKAMQFDAILQSVFSAGVEHGESTIKTRLESFLRGIS
jgi:hypothetical protein